eukprot:gene396-722_t
MSQFVRLDNAGNIDTDVLSKELKSSLEFDIKYKQTDNMKKKAVKIAKDYDEFKNFVACAHLKTLSRKEVESLGDTKRGWQKTSVVRKPTANILSQERSQEEMNTNTSIPGGSFRKPRTNLELDRDWRRLTEDKKLSYLKKVGLVKMKKLLQTDCDAGFIEDLLRTLIATANSSTNLNLPKDEDQLEHSNANEWDKNAIYEWLKAVTSFQRFDLNMKFVESDIKQRIIIWLTNFGDDEAISELIKNKTHFRVGKFLIAISLKYDCGSSLHNDDQRLLFNSSDKRIIT